MNKKSVLIIDDAMFMRRLLKDMIERDGYCEVVGEGANGYEAINKAKELQPDIITMDIIMPELDGIDAVKEILVVSPMSKIIMISSVGNHKVVNDAIDAGAFDYLVKPLNKEEISRVIRKALSV